VITVDERHTQRRDAVQAFKLVVCALVNPVSVVIDELSWAAEYLTQLSPELPLLAFSPFEVLPSDIERPKKKSADFSHQGNYTLSAADKVHLVSSKMSGAIEPVPSGRKKRKHTEMATETDSSAAQFPIFSFAKREDPVYEHKGRRSSSSVSGNSWEKGKSDRKPIQEFEKVAPGETGKQNVTNDAASSRANNWIEQTPVSTPASNSGVETYLSGEDHSIQTRALLDELVNSLLKEPQSASDKHTGISQIGREDVGRITQHTESASVINRFPSSAEQFDNQQAGRIRSPVSGGVADKLHSSSDESSENFSGSPVQKQNNDKTIQLIDALAEQLFAVEGNSKSQTSDLCRHAVQKAAMLSNAVPASLQASATSESKLAHEDFMAKDKDNKAITFPEVRRRSMDELNQMTSLQDPWRTADRLAELINDVLVEQARRHGVDLS
jgi:hypothetical protein